MACVVFSPLFTKVVALTVESTTLSNRFLISLITFFNIIIIDSVELNHWLVMMDSSVGALLHPNHQNAANILLFSFVLSDQKLKKENVR